MNKYLYQLKIFIFSYYLPTLLIFFISALLPQITSAQDYPNRPIRIVVGPGTDLLARILADKLTENWGQPVFVDIKPAAGGLIAGDFVAKAGSDGYTLLLSSSAYTINSVLQVKPSFDFAKDLRPVNLLATIPIILVVNNQLPVENLKELIDLAKSKPGKLNYASSGNGTPAHLAGEMLKQAGNIDLLHVPYKGITPAITDLMGGQVQIMFAVAPAVIGLIKSGKLKAISISSAQRYKLLPEIPTIAEQGFPEFIYVGWNGIHVPTKTPSEIIQKLSSEINKIMSQATILPRIDSAGFETFTGNIKDFENFQQQDINRIKKIVKEANIKPD